MRSDPPSSARSSPEAPPGAAQARRRVAIVGAASGLAERLLTPLAASPAVAGCEVVPLERETLAARLARQGADTVVCGGGSDLIPDAEAAAVALGAAAEAGVAAVVLLSSAAVHEPSHHHPGYVDEAYRGSGRHRNPLPRAWRRLERLAAEVVAGVAVLTVLRPVPVLLPGSEGVWSRLLAGRLASPLPGFDPTVQLLAPEDLAAAVRRAVEARRAGVYHVAPAAAIPLRRALRLAGVRRLPWPRTLRYRATRRPLDAVEYLRHPWTVSAAAIRRDLGFAAQRTSAEAVLAFAAGKPGRPVAVEDRSAAGRRGGLDFDPFGLDPGYVDAYGRTLFRFLHDLYWRVEIRGLEHVPCRGRAVLAGVHRGFMPWDGVMAVHAIAGRLGRYPRFLIHPTLVKFPFLAPYMTKLGGILAARANGDWVLQRDGLLAIYPEGIRGAFTNYRRAYRLGKFGRDEYVRFALRNGAPIIPFVTVGSAEIFPILGRIDWAWWRRMSEWPFLPITPTMGLVPLPSKWHTHYLEPLHVEADHPPEAAEDVETVRAISREVRRRMRRAIDAMLAARRSIFWGSVFPREPG